MTRSRARLADAGGCAGSSSSEQTAAPNPARSAGSSTSRPDFAVHDLVGDAADGACDYRAALEHRLGDGQAEALGEALLRHDRGVSLQRVDRRARSRRGRPSGRSRDAHGRVRRAAARATRRRQSSSTCSRLGIVRYAAHLGPDQRERASMGERGATCSANACMTPAMSFIESQRETWTTSGAPTRRRRAGQQGSKRRSNRAGVPSRRRNGTASHVARRSSRRPASASTRSTSSAPAARSWSRTDRSTAGSRPAAVPSPRRRKRAAREHERVRHAVEVGPQKRPRALGVPVRRVTPDVAAPDDERAARAQRPREPGRLRVVQQHDVSRDAPWAAGLAR